MKQTLALIAGPLAFLVIGLIPFDGLEPAAQSVLALTAWMAIWWVTEAIPMSATALLPVTVLPLLQAIGLKPAAAVYSSPIIFLFLGGFHGLEHRKWDCTNGSLSIIKRTGRSRSISLDSYWPLRCPCDGHCHDLDVCPFLALELDRPGTLLSFVGVSASVEERPRSLAPTNPIFGQLDELLGRSVSFYEWTLQLLPSSYRSSAGST